MKRRLAVFATLALLFFSASIVFAEYWGSKKSNKYHLPTCKWAQKINPDNLVKFETPESAMRAGYVPCKVCRPPAGSKAEITKSWVALAKLETPDDPQRRGCCSHHGGVCGCQNGRALCCDGTLSPSCGCD